jgi:hypothetical protein
MVTGMMNELEALLEGKRTLIRPSRPDFPKSISFMLVLRQRA